MVKNGNKSLAPALLFCILAMLPATGYATASFDTRDVSPLPVSTLKTSADVPQAHPADATAAQGTVSAKVYDFKALYKGLAYTDSYFGAGEDELFALNTYTSTEDTYYKEINDYLRFHPAPYDWSGTSPEDAKKLVADIDRVFTRVPALPQDIMLFRGLDLAFRGNKSYTYLEEFTDKAYFSTSTSFKVAKRFAENEDKPEAKKAVFAIYANRAGEKGILVGQGEDEVILRRGLKFKVMAKKKSSGSYELYLVQVCSAPCEKMLRKDVSSFWESFLPQ